MFLVYQGGISPFSHLFVMVFPMICPFSYGFSIVFCERLPEATHHHHVSPPRPPLAAREREKGRHVRAKRTEAAEVARSDGQSPGETINGPSRGHGGGGRNQIFRMMKGCFDYV